MALGNLSRERYQKMSEGYEAEQAALNNEIIGLEDWVGTREDANNSVDAFLSLVKKYVDIPELTPTIVNEFIKKIIVYAPEKQGTKRIQKIRIIITINALFSGLLRTLFSFCQGLFLYFIGDFWLT